MHFKTAELLQWKVVVFWLNSWCMRHELVMVNAVRWKRSSLGAVSGTTSETKPQTVS